MKHHVTERIWNKSKEPKLPIYVVIDDTIGEKTISSSEVEQPIYGYNFHHLHLKNNKVFGQQFVTVMLKCGDLILPYDTVLYEKDKDIKIQIAKRIISALKKTINGGYILTDSWYSCQELFEAANEARYGYIGALKNICKIYPLDTVKMVFKLVHLLRPLHLRNLIL